MEESESTKAATGMYPFAEDGRECLWGLSEMCFSTAFTVMSSFSAISRFLRP